MIRRIEEDWHRYPCRHPEHNPPNMIVLPPGLHEHECPSCGAKQRFRVPELPQLSAPAAPYPSLDAVGITPDHKMTTTGKVSFPLRVYDHRNEPVGWAAEDSVWSDT